MDRDGRSQGMPPAGVSDAGGIEMDRATVLLQRHAPPALTDVRLRVRAGERLVVAGADGAGKSTLLRLLAGLVDCSRGRVRVRVRDMAYVGPDPAAQVVAGTCAEDVAAGLEFRGVPRPQMRDVVPALLAAVGLAGRDEDPPAVLSGGERQRLAYAAAVASLAAGAGDQRLPALLIVDDAASQLDAAARQQIDVIIRDWLSPDAIVVASAADPATAVPQAERLLVLDAGRVAFDGLFRDFCANPAFAERVGVAVPDAARVAAELADRGVPLAGIPTNLDELLGLAGVGR